jgi:hypothetical protein
MKNIQPAVFLSSLDMILVWADSWCGTMTKALQLSSGTGRWRVLKRLQPTIEGANAGDRVKEAFLPWGLVFMQYIGRFFTAERQYCCFFIE